VRLAYLHIAWFRLARRDFFGNFGTTARDRAAATLRPLTMNCIATRRVVCDQKFRNHANVFRLQHKVVLFEVISPYPFDADQTVILCFARPFLSVVAIAASASTAFSGSNMLQAMTGPFDLGFLDRSACFIPRLNGQLTGEWW
jgi:hypothetical protein